MSAAPSNWQGHIARWEKEEKPPSRRKNYSTQRTPERYFFLKKQTDPRGEQRHSSMPLSIFTADECRVGWCIQPIRHSPLADHVDSKTFRIYPYTSASASTTSGESALVHFTIVYSRIVLRNDILAPRERYCVRDSPSLLGQSC
jgi:hypothetical protein